MNRPLKSLLRLLKSAARNPRMFLHAANNLPLICAGTEHAKAYCEQAREPAPAGSSSPGSNPLWDYFQNLKEGPGIWHASLANP